MAQHRGLRSRTSLLVGALALATVALTGCGGGSNDADDDPAGSTSDAVEATSDAPVEATDAAVDPTPADDGDDDSEDGSDDGADADCNDLTPAAISAAAGGVAFDTVSDVSVDQDSSCVFTAATQTYGISVMEEDLETFLAGDLSGLSTADANATLASFTSMALTDPTTSAITVGGTEGVLVVGETLTGGQSATAMVVIDDDVHQVTADGDALGDLGAVATAVLELAVAS